MLKGSRSRIIQLNEDEVKEVKTENFILKQQITNIMEGYAVKEK